MASRKEHKKPLVAVQEGGAQEDGDFVALRESRNESEGRLSKEMAVLEAYVKHSGPWGGSSQAEGLRVKPMQSGAHQERLEKELSLLEAYIHKGAPLQEELGTPRTSVFALSDKSSNKRKHRKKSKLRRSKINTLARTQEAFTLPDVEPTTEDPRIFSPPPDYSSAISRPGSGGTRPRSGRPANRKKSPATGNYDPWDDLTDAALADVEEFRVTVTRIHTKYGLSKPKLQDPKNGMNILHFALDNSHDSIVDHVVEIADIELIQHPYEVTVSKITGKRNALHQVVERNDLPRLKLLLNKLPIAVRMKTLLEETRVEIKGQRPRTFTCFHLAAFYGFTDIVVYLLEIGCDVNHLNAKKDTALLWAARWGHKECVSTLLQRGAKTGLENDKGSTAIYWAIRYGHVETVQLLAKVGGANVNQTRKLGMVAPIVLACALGLEDIVKILLDFGADPNMKIRAGERPIHHAAREGFSNIIELLLTRGAAIDHVDERGDSALLLAARHGMAKAMHTLLTHGASVSTKNLMGEGVWEIAAGNEVDVILKILVLHQRKRAQEDGNYDTDLLSSPGVNSLIFLAASYGNLERLKLLLNDMKLDSSVTDENGNNFLHHAALNNQAEVIKAFHKQVNPDNTNNMGNTALHEACTKGQHEAILELINIKAMANVRNNKGETALHVAAYSSAIQPHSVSSMMDYVIRTHPYECLNIKDNKGNSCLHIAAKHAKPDVLWEFRFVRFKDADVKGNIPLHESVREGEPECLETMLDIYDAMKRDCDINHQNSYFEETPLFLAAKEGFIDGVRRLLLFGADISISDLKGDTPLHELTRRVVEDPIHKHTYMELIDIILDHAFVWYCNKHNITYHESDREQLSDLRRRGILSLVMDIHNKTGLSVLDHACKLGAAPVVRVLTNMPHVTIFKSGRNTRYDITHITPKTNDTLPSMMSRGGSVAPKASCLEWLLSMDNPQGAARILDIQPFSDIERAYSSVAAWTYAIIMVFHIAYMSIFTWTGVHLLDKERRGDDDSEKDHIEVAMYCVVPIEPALIILYNSYHLLKMGCAGQLRIKLREGLMAVIVGILPVLVYLVYAVLAMLWIILYAVDFDKKDYFLSIALLIGWLTSIAFTRGFKVIHYFWRMIQNMILKDIFKFMVIYLFVLLAFSFAMHSAIQFSSTLTEKFSNPFHTMFMVFNLMVGMTDLFDGELEDNTDVSRNILYLKIVYVVYIILATIVLLNLLIAMMNDSYQAIQQKQSLSWRIESVQLGVDVEKTMPVTFQLFSKVKAIKGFICPLDKDKQMARWYIEVRGFRETFPVLSTDEEEKQILAGIQESLSNMEAKFSEQINSLKTHMENMQGSLKSVEQALDRRTTTAS